MTTDRKTPLCEVLAAAPLKVAAVGDDGVAAAALPDAPATPGTPAAFAAPAAPAAVAAGGAAVAPASLAAGVPAARPTLVPEVAKCICGTASWVESSEVVAQPEAMALVAWTWTWPSVIWLTRPPATEQGMVTVTEIGIVVDGTLLDGAEVGAGLPGTGAVVVVVWPAWTGEAGAGVTVPAGVTMTAGLLPAGETTTAGLLPAGGAAELLPTEDETGTGMSSTDLVTIAGCWGTYWAQRPW